MRILLKILLAPILLSLTLIVWICSALLYVSSWIFDIVSSLLGILAVLVMFGGSVNDGIVLLIMAALVSPCGLPMFTAWIIGQIQKARFAIMEI